MLAKKCPNFLLDLGGRTNESLLPVVVFLWKKKKKNLWRLFKLTQNDF